MNVFTVKTFQTPPHTHSLGSTLSSVLVADLIYKALLIFMEVQTHLWVEKTPMRAAMVNVDE